MWETLRKPAVVGTLAFVVGVVVTAAFLTFRGERFTATLAADAASLDLEGPAAPGNYLVIRDAPPTSSCAQPVTVYIAPRESGHARVPIEPALKPGESLRIIATSPVTDCKRGGGCSDIACQDAAEQTLAPKDQRVMSAVCGTPPYPSPGLVTICLDPQTGG